MRPTTSASPPRPHFVVPRHVEVLAPVKPECESVLTPAALEFVAGLAREFGPRRDQLMLRRAEIQTLLDRGWRPDFLPETAAVRRAEWKVAAAPADLRDRRVEITGPVDRKMILNALNSGARTYMADFEDSHSPTWDATLQGQANLSEAVRGTLRHVSPEGKTYVLGAHLATLMMRPRGWHLDEKHLSVDGRPVPAALFDFGLFFFHNARALLDRGSGPYFYLPKLENHLEARLWNDVFLYGQEWLGIPRGSIRATVLLETILAAFEMDEILYELREHSAGLNCGRWDYIFSYIKKFRNRADCVLPDRAQVAMTTHFLRSYSLQTIKTCHRRGTHAIGGMAAQIPIKGDPAANEEALAKVRADKEREAHDGHDGTWVAHPGLVALATAEFDQVMPGPEQIARKRDDVKVTAEDLLATPAGTITEEGARLNFRVSVQYLDAWLRGIGCVPLYNLMEDAATAEISRSQLWQWLHQERGVLEDGRRFDRELYQRLRDEELTALRARAPVPGSLDDAATILDRVIQDDDFAEFLTRKAYDYLD